MCNCLKRGKSKAERFPKQTVGRSPASFFCERIFEIPLVEDGPESVIRFERQLFFYDWKKGGTAKQTPFVLL
jgi:hypothetical protein